MLPIWTRCEDVSCGQDAVHAAKELYLPRLKDQSNDDYASYVKRATFYNATWRTIAGMLGMLFRKPLIIDVPAAIEPLLEDISMDGSPLQVFAQEVAEECFEKGRCGLLVDFPQADIQSATVADAQRLGLRPSIQIYEAQTIINWRTDRINNKSVISLVVLSEDSITLKDEFTEIKTTHYRVLDLFDKKYRVRVFEVSDSGIDVLLDEKFPLMNNKPMDFIPFVFMSTDDLTPDVDDPPLIDLVNMNLSHYRTTADYEHGCHFTGLPTAVVSGYVADKGEKLYIGSQSAWVFPDPSAKASYLEFTGQGLTALENNLVRKEMQMAILGARMLEVQKRGIESADTASIHRKGEESILASIAQVISMGMTRAISWFAQWAGADHNVKFEINRDFYPVEMTPQELTALIAAWQTGGISKQVLFDNLKQGEIIASEVTFEEEEARISNSQPTITAPAGG
jgi:hypothetical protein